MLASFHLVLQAAIFKHIVSNKITFFILWFWIRQNKYHVDIKWNIYHKYCLFPFSQSKLVKQCFIELLCRMTKIWFFHMKLFFLKICVLIFVCMYFLYCDTLKKIHHNCRHYHFQHTWIKISSNDQKPIIHKDHIAGRFDNQ